MRIRIIEKLDEEVDGVALGNFQVGLVYDVSPSLATYLVTLSAAEAVTSDDPALVVPLGGDVRIDTMVDRVRDVVHHRSGVRHGPPKDNN